MRITGGGYVGVNRSSPLSWLHVSNGELSGSTNPTSAAAPNTTYDALVVDGEVATIVNIRSRASGDLSYGRLAFSDDVRSRGYVDYRHRDGSGGALEFMSLAVAASEKVRIPAATWGLLVTNFSSTGNTGGYQTEGVSLRYDGDSTFVKSGGPPVTLTRKTNAGKVLDFYNTTTYAGGIYVNGSGNTAIQQTSDYRLKKDVSSMTDGITKVKLLNPIYFKNNTGLDTTTTQNGFLAHEIQTVIPTLVDGEKDGDIDERGKGYQTMDYAGLTPTLTAAVKELIAKVETLESEVATLKGS